MAFNNYEFLGFQTVLKHLSRILKIGTEANNLMSAEQGRYLLLWKKSLKQMRLKNRGSAIRWHLAKVTSQELARIAV